ncbi:MAG: M56 family metallopeptidase [Planctomycetota bacterium]|jgi:beta-lactamase regulating signal transducer with metallopeptidase domain
MYELLNYIIEGINRWGEYFSQHASAMLIQSSALIALLFLTDLILRKHIRSVFRYWLWILVLVKLVLPVSLTSPTGINYWLADYWPIPAKTIFASADASAPASAEMALPIQPGSSVTPPAASALQSFTPSAWIFIAWIIGVTVLGGLLLRQLRRVNRLLARARDAGSEVTDCLQKCRNHLGLWWCHVSVKITDDMASPSVCGTSRPTILLPGKLVDSLTTKQLQAVLIHELAHIKRGDLPVNLIQTVLQIVYFYNPLLWIANIAIRRLREQAVDEMTLVILNRDTTEYSNTLLDIAEMAFHRPAVSLRFIGIVESKKALSQRIKRITNRPIPGSAKLGVLGTIMLVAMAAVLLPMAKAENPDTHTKLAPATSKNKPNQPVKPEQVKTLREFMGPVTTQPSSTTTKPAAEGKYPKIRCDNPVFEFSNVWGGEKVKNTFTIHNDGDAPLQITKIKTSCGCTAAPNYDRNIPPGKQGVVTLELKTSPRSTKKTVNATVHCNDPVTPTLRLTMTGKTKLRFTMHPVNATWRRIRRNQKLEPRKITITNNTATPMKLQPLKQKDKTIFTHTIKEIKPGKVYEVTVIPKGPFKEGVNREYIHFNTGVPEQKQIQIMCYLYMLPLVEVTPPAGMNILLNIPRNRSKPMARVSVKYNGDGQMKITSAVADNPGVKVEVKPQSAGRSYYITAEITDHFKPDPVSTYSTQRSKSSRGNKTVGRYRTTKAKILVTTNVKEKPIEIPIKILGPRSTPKKIK